MNLDFFLSSPFFLEKSGFIEYLLLWDVALHKFLFVISLHIVDVKLL